MFMEKCLELYPKWAAITAVALLIKHLLLPYHYREKFPYDDPPPKFLGPFSLGELVQYIIQVLSFPLIAFFVVFLELPDNSDGVIFCILLFVWWVAPKALAQKIDGW